MRNNQWHARMYDEELARDSIESNDFKRLAKKEVAALISLLTLKPGDKVLDVPCGTGRHAIQLAKRGMKVTGVDINPTLLKMAKANARGSSISFQRGDMLKLGKFRGEFDAVLNLFTSFGYFRSDKQNEHALKQMISTLKPGGKLVIHVVNPVWLLTVFQSLHWGETKSQFKFEIRQYNAEQKRIRGIRVVIDKKSGKSKSNFHQIRLYSKREMFSLMKKCGLKNLKAIGDYEGSAFLNRKSTHPLYIGMR